MIIEAAPVAGYTDQAFRRVLIKCGAEVVYTEMVSATALFHGSQKTLELLNSDFDAKSPIDGERVKTVVQLFGKVPEHFAFAIKSGHLDKFDEININMGCPAPKIVRNGEGCALMKNPGLARQIIEACVSVADKPVTVKFRLGFTEPSHHGPKELGERKEACLQQLVQFAKMCEDAGASKLIVHGRYASQGYSGVADWEQIAKVVETVNIPVLANGDVADPASARRCIEVTGAAGIMLARALFGAPWRIALRCIPPFAEIKEIVRFHVNTVLELCGEEGFREMKKHLLHYCDSLGVAKDVKRHVAVSKDFGEALGLMNLT